MSRLALNLLTNIGGFFVTLVVGIWYTPFLVHQLGVERYGLIPLTNQVASYLTMVGVVVWGTLSRYLTLSLRQEKKEEAQGYFATSFYTLLFVSLPILLGIGGLTYLLPHWMVIPAGVTAASQVLVLLTLTSSLIVLVMSPYLVLPYVANRFDLLNGVQLTLNLGRVLLVVIFFYWFGASLEWVGIAVLLATLTQALWAIKIKGSLFPQLRLSPVHFRPVWLKPLTVMGGWLLLDQVGSLLIVSIDLVLVNRLLGPFEGGRYGAVLQWATMITAISGIVAAVFGPPSLYAYAENNPPALFQKGVQAMKLVGVIVGLPISLVTGLGEPLLRVWLGEAFIPLTPLLSLLVFPLSLNLPITPLFIIQTASGRVALPALVTLGAGVINVGLAYLLAVKAGWGLLGIAASRAITLTARNLLFSLPYISTLVGVSPLSFYPPLGKVFLVSLSILAICRVGSELLLPTEAGWVHLILLALGVGSLYLTVVYRWLLTSDERRALSEAVSKLVRRSVA